MGVADTAGNAAAARASTTTGSRKAKRFPEKAHGRVPGMRAVTWAPGAPCAIWARGFLFPLSQFLFSDPYFVRGRARSCAARSKERFLDCATRRPANRGTGKSRVASLGMTGGGGGPVRARRGVKRDSSTARPANRGAGKSRVASLGMTGWGQGRAVMSELPMGIGTSAAPTP
jgi:hypothetical protein